MEQKRLLLSGEFVALSAGAITVAELADDHRDSRKGQVSVRAWESDESALRVHIVPAFGRLPISSISSVHWIAAGVDIKPVSAWLGHSTAKLTLDTYGHLMGTDADRAALDRSIGHLATPPLRQHHWGMREPVRRFLDLGQMPDEDDHTIKQSDIDVVGEALAALPKPCDDDEALALLDAFPPADGTCFGLAWTLLHHIETAPNWPRWEALDDRSWWVSRLRHRAENGRQVESPHIS